MKRALSQSEIERLERVSVEGTYGAVSREAFPQMNPCVTDCGGKPLEREYVQRKRDEAAELGDTRVVKLYDALLAMFIDESDAVM